jgi:O-antigen/teichoic acid export membrane protein
MTDAPAVSRRRITGDVAVQLGGRGVNLVLGVIVTLVVVRTLGDDRFGQWATILSIVQIASFFGELGLEQVAVARAAADRERAREWIGALVTMRLLIGIPVTLLSMVAVVLVSDDADMRMAGLIMSLTLLLGAPSALRLVFQLRIRNDVPTLMSFLNSVLWTIAAVVILSRSEELVPLALALAAITVATSLLQAIWALRVLPDKLDLRASHWRELLIAGSWVGLAAVLTTAFVKIDQVFVFELAGSRDAGLYGSVYRILDQAQVLPIVAMTTLMPLMSAAFQSDPQRGRRIFGMTLDFLVVASLPALAFTIAAATPTIELLFGEEFLDAAPALPVLMGAYVLTAMSYAVDAVIVIYRDQRKLAWNAGIALVVNVALNLALVPTYGFMAAAWATVVTQVVILALNIRVVLPRLGGRLPGLDRLFRAALAAGAMGVVAWLLVEGGVHVIIVGVLSLVAYAGFAIGLRAVEPDELRSLLRREADVSTG